ncbi:MAG: Crp/Fnr family transcriptional regulator [Eubacteriales bacterium]
MIKYLPDIKEAPLFANVRDAELEPVLSCLDGHVKVYEKGEYVSLAYEEVKNVGLVLKGTIQMVQEDMWGRKTLLMIIHKNELFGETFICGDHVLPTVSFYASTNVEVLFLPIHRVMHTCSNACEFHHNIIENLIKLVANKNEQFISKIEILSQKSLRDKISVYLSIEAKRSQSDYFELQTGRVEMAEYLCADRSALTRELNSMKKEGLIDYDKNTFRIIK